MYVLCLTYSGSVFPYKPQVVAEEGQNTDAEHGRHKKEEQHVEFGTSVRQLILTGTKKRKRTCQCQFAQTESKREEVPVESVRKREIGEKRKKDIRNAWL